MAETQANEETTRLVGLTDGKQSRPIKLSIGNATVDELIKQGKNKFKRKFKYIVYPEGTQVVKSNDELHRVLQKHSGKLTLILTNTEPEQKDADFSVSSNPRGVSYIIANEDTIEPEAESQLCLAASLEGCLFALGMPDLHPGKGIPIGAVVMTNESIAYPQLVDNDIGCGMSFVETSLQRDKLSISKLRKIATSLESIDKPVQAQSDLQAACSKTLHWGGRSYEPLPPLSPPHHYHNLGTIGGGNHFAELQQFDHVFDLETIQRYEIDVDKVHLLVHSGSRGLGSQTLREFCDQAQSERVAGQGGHYGAATDSVLFESYIAKHDVALNYAARNRRLIAQRLLDQISGDSDPVCKIDIFHNFMEKVELSSFQAIERIQDQGKFPKSVSVKDIHDEGNTPVVGWLHRKGATPTTQSRVLVIPGSRGSLSYLVEVNTDAEHVSGYSLAHGAGRRMNRSKALAKHKNQYPNSKQLLQTDLDSVVVCDKKDLVYEEAPAAYKDIDSVVKCLVDDVVDANGRGIVRVLATLRPLLTYKYKDPYDKS